MVFGMNFCSTGGIQNSMGANPLFASVQMKMQMMQMQLMQMQMQMMAMQTGQVTNPNSNIPGCMCNPNALSPNGSVFGPNSNAFGMDSYNQAANPNLNTNLFGQQAVSGMPHRQTIWGQGATPVQRGADAGRIVDHLNRSGQGNVLANSNIEYMNYDPARGTLSLDSGLAYSKESLRSLDRDGDGRVTVEEVGPQGQTIDINGDGIISAGENLAFTMLQDSTGNMDGIVSPEEVQTGNSVLNNKEYAQSKLRQLYDGHNMAQREFNLFENNAANPSIIV